MIRRRASRMRQIDVYFVNLCASMRGEETWHKAWKSVRMVVDSAKGPNTTVHWHDPITGTFAVQNIHNVAQQISALPPRSEASESESVGVVVTDDSNRLCLTVQPPLQSNTLLPLYTAVREKFDRTVVVVARDDHSKVTQEHLVSVEIRSCLETQLDNDCLNGPHGLLFSWWQESSAVQGCCFAKFILGSEALVAGTEMVGPLPATPAVDATSVLSVSSGTSLTVPAAAQFNASAREITSDGLGSEDEADATIRPGHVVFYVPFVLWLVGQCFPAVQRRHSLYGVFRCLDRVSYYLDISLVYAATGVGREGDHVTEYHYVPDAAQHRALRWAVLRHCATCLMRCIDQFQGGSPGHQVTRRVDEELPLLVRAGIKLDIIHSGDSSKEGIPQQVHALKSTCLKQVSLEADPGELKYFLYRPLTLNLVEQFRLQRSSRSDDESRSVAMLLMCADVCYRSSRRFLDMVNSCSGYDLTIVCLVYDIGHLESAAESTTHSDSGGHHAAQSLMSPKLELAMAGMRDLDRSRIKVVSWWNLPRQDQVNFIRQLLQD
eukprot:scpid39210/ scgid6914/ 